MQTNACANKLKKETKKYLTLLFDTITFKCNERKDLFHLCQYLSFSIIVCIALHIIISILPYYWNKWNSKGANTQRY